MHLPKLSVPTFFLEMPSSGKKHKFRPYLVKEQKILLIALEGGNKEELINAVNETIDCCVDGVEAEKLPSFDFIYTYLKLYIASNGEEVALKLPHMNNSECNHVTQVSINLNDVKIKKHDNHTNTIDLTDDVGVVMKYPTAMNLVETIQEIRGNLSTFDQSLIRNCIESIYDKENVYHLKDFSDDDITEWCNSLGKKELVKIQEFFTTMPEIYIQVEYTCPVCQKKESVTITQFSDFFTSP